MIEVVPENQRTILLNWMDNIRDWCISRQLWWGHRIPIWHCADCKEIVPATDSRVESSKVTRAPPEFPRSARNAAAQSLRRIPTSSTHGSAPPSGHSPRSAGRTTRRTCATFYPTSLLISGYDILFFWDVRMIMMGLHLTGGATAKDRVPFAPLPALARAHLRRRKDVQDEGTGVDPLELTQQYGTDALRYMLASMAAPGTDIVLSEDRILSARVLREQNLECRAIPFRESRKVEASGLTLEELAAPEIRAEAPYPVKGEGALAHRWIFSRLAAVTAQVNTRSKISAFTKPPDDLSLLLGRFLRLVHRVGQAATGRP